MEKFGYSGGYTKKHAAHLKQGTDEILARIYEAVFEPLEMMIETNRIIIIPHGPLHYVPFHALSDGLEYLLDQFEISRAPSASVLKMCRASARRRSRQKTMLAVGVSAPDLPHVEDEIAGLCEVFADAVALTGSEATQKNFLRLASCSRYLHIASHGRFRQDNPMFSSLRLADSHLNFYGLLDLRLRAEMVTLSACQTGVSAIIPGDELHGLMRGFLCAGAPSLVVSLWMVSDRSTALLMTEMYKRISAGETKRAALRAAQLEVRNLYPHPYYWAPFVLMGNPN
ncbi:MAG: CHAT domain-containing protein, partial [Acidobacteriota bacterium]